MPGIISLASGSLFGCQRESNKSQGVIFLVPGILSRKPERQGAFPLYNKTFSECYGVFLGSILRFLGDRDNFLGAIVLFPGVREGFLVARECFLGHRECFFGANNQP